ncbi:penicillin-binding protein 1A [Janthinobacterium agaricidamnosum]|uniref:Transglycosylase family protein n=1 Tax=Janthinobacterium agaricidamnosum NBRC 102515 = DSM 9628 TaxID=1349767 RepID=W0V267_9BURK|nr:transglycosylase domain-containing protein [Janthinobacterium agaricidamnosum]CDG82924.1 transglycosylase family protein [Janthinobacterium agaricidamnosum NBRC 102515 = DSM 9628]
MDQQNKNNKAAGRWRLPEWARAAATRCQALYVRGHAHLMRRPPARRALLLLVWGGGALCGLLLIYLLILIPLTPGIADLRQARIAQASTVVSADGKLLASFDEGLQERVTLKQIAPQVVSALIATEDRRFYDHHGIDFHRIGGAMLASAKGDAQGGSTITQQLARNMFPEEIGRSRNLNRKLKELITALKIEATYSKTEILEAYLNTVPFLYNTFGIEMAARTYFDKPAARLDILESATLVGMLKGTNYYNPVNNPERSVQRRNVVLGQMRKQDVITEARYRELLKRPLRLHFARQTERSQTDTHFTAYVRKWLLDWADENDYNLQLDGLVVHTTLDFALQTAAMKAVERQGNALQMIADVEWSRPGLTGSTSTGTFAEMHGGIKPFDYFWQSHGALADAVVRESASYRKAVEGGEAPAEVLKRLKADRNFISQLHEAKSRLEAGFVAMDPASGELKAWVGSRNFQREQFDHVSQAARQPGSTFKPIVYGAALEKGLLPDHLYRDAVLDIKAADGTIWRPTDMSGTSGQQIPMRDGLIYSKNTITAQVMQDTGLPGIIKLARGLGIRDSKLQAVPSLALGTSPVTLLEMVNAYASIAAQGAYRKPVFVTHITDRSGKTIASFSSDKTERALSETSAVELIDMMRGVINRGTGTGIRYRFGINSDVAGKTGTTQNNADGWFILMHPNLVAGAWVGFNDARVTMRSNYWGQGGHNAVLLVGDFFKTAIDSGKLDRNAIFPGGHRPAPLKPEEPPEEAVEEPGDLQPEGGVPAVPAATAAPTAPFPSDAEQVMPGPDRTAPAAPATPPPDDAVRPESP